MTQRVSVYSGFTAKLKSGPRRQFGPRRSPERFWCFHRVIGPIQLYGNTDFHLGRSWVKTGYVAHGHFCCIHRYTRTRVASRPSRAIQLYSAIHYTAVQRCTQYNLYNPPLRSGRLSAVGVIFKRLVFFETKRDPESLVPSVMYTNRVNRNWGEKKRTFIRDLLPP